MKKPLLLALSAFLSASAPVLAQTTMDVNSPMRAFVSANLEPFFHGVASGDPLSDRVILWTRFTPDNQITVDINWKVCTDTTMSTIVSEGSATTDETKDFTVKVDASGLQPNTWYYYQFEEGGRKSLIGRTRTLPVGDVDSLRFGIVSCSSYEDGFFNAYNNLVQRNDIDAIIHLGDYIYEYGVGGSASVVGGRFNQPENEIISLSDYRTRYSLYRLDKDLMWLHQNYPFIAVWDDHEIANNTWEFGAENHTEGDEGAFLDRKSVASKAYEEWLPKRLLDPANNQKIFRQFQWGNLINLFAIDSRSFGRDIQVGASDPITNDTSRTMLGEEQLDWLLTGLEESSAKWNVLANQVMMAPLQALGQVVNTDQWDGYPAERNKIYSTILNNNIPNFVVLTGDIHTSWSNDLPNSDGSYDENTGQGSVGVEFVGTSVTSGSAPLSIPGGTALISAFNPHIKYVDFSKKGYMILDVNKTRTQCDHVYVSTVTDTVYTATPSTFFYTLDGERWLREGNQASIGNINPPLSPRPGQPEPSAINEAKPVLLGAFPNPFAEKFVLQYYTSKACPVSIQLLDINGRMLLTESHQLSQAGIQYWEVNGSVLAPGTYFVDLTVGNKTFSRKVIKK